MDWSDIKVYWWLLKRSHWFLVVHWCCVYTRDIFLRFTTDQDQYVTFLLVLRGEDNWRNFYYIFNWSITWGNYCDNLYFVNYKVDMTFTCFTKAIEVRGVNISQRNIPWIIPWIRKELLWNQHRKYTGHIVEAHCDWSTIVKGKLYRNNISLDPGGPRGTVGPNENYTMYQKVDIWY